MALSDCPDCQRLKKEYAAATHARFRAEADLTSATYSRNSAEIKQVKRIARTRLARWARAAEALRQHEQTHEEARSAGTTA